MHRITPGLLAVLVGVVLSGLLLVPFLALSFRRRGRAAWGRSLQWMGLLVSFLALWSYTIFPAPWPTDDYACRTPNLDPMTDVRDILAIHEAGVSLVANGALQVVLLNVLFFVPVGFFVRTLFSWGVIRAAVTGLVLSLAVETTQLTGLWGVYPCAYRLFSVNDLIDNTLGAVLGSLAALVVVRLRPRRARQLPLGEYRTVPVSLGRRVLAAVADVVMIYSISVTVGLVLAQTAQSFGRQPNDGIEQFAGIGVAFVVYAVPILVSGASLGERAVLIDSRGGWRPLWLARTVRIGLGLGGCFLLGEWMPLLALAWAACIVLVIVIRRDHRSPAAVLAGMGSMMRTSGGEAS